MTRSRRAVVILAPPNTVLPSLNSRFVVKIDEVEEQPAAGLGERDISKFIHDDTISGHELLFDPAGFAVAFLFLFDEQIEQIHAVEEAYFAPFLDQFCAKGRCDMGFACSSSADPG